MPHHGRPANAPSAVRGHLTALAMTIALAFGAASGVRADDAPPSTPAPAGVEIGADVASLPPAVQEMREAILEAVAKADIEAIRLPIEMNEIPPVIGTDDDGDRIATLKAASIDGEGREALAILSEILGTGFARLEPGSEQEMIVWPYLAALPIDKLTPRDEIALYRIVPRDAAAAMRTSGRYDYWRIGISAKGVWHFLETGAAAAP